MLSIPQEIRQQLATRMHNPTIKKMFSLPTSQLTKEHSKMVQALVAAGTDNKTALAYLTVMPLLLEQEAITDLVDEVGDPELRAVLPDVATLADAIRVGTKEYQLTTDQSNRLMQLLMRAQELASQA